MSTHRTPRTSAAARSLDAARSRLAEQGVALTGPRATVLDVVFGLRTHPTADEVFAQAARRQPGIGRATVYRALEAFVAAGVLSKASHTGAAVRYDATLDQHHHLVCLRCDRVIDFQDRRLDRVPVPDTSKLGFLVEEMQVQLRGLCRECRRKEKRT